MPENLEKRSERMKLTEQKIKVLKSKVMLACIKFHNRKQALSRAVDLTLEFVSKEEKGKK